MSSDILPDVPVTALPQALPEARRAALDLRSVYDSHFPFVWRNLLRLGVPKERLEDAAQEVFLVAHRRWSSFDSARATAQTWLFGIVAHVASNERRSGRRRTARLIPVPEHEFWDSVPCTVAGPAEVLAKREAARLLLRLLESLSDEGRAILLLVDIEAMSVSEAAQALHWNVNTAYGRLRIARAAFQRALVRLRAEQARSRGSQA